MKMANKKKEMLINVLQSEECRIAIVENGILEELYLERTSQESYVGNIYRGRIVNIEPSIQAAFVDFGVGRNGFLHVSDVDPQYFRQRTARGKEDLTEILDLPEVPDQPFIDEDSLDDDEADEVEDQTASVQETDEEWDKEDDETNDSERALESSLDAPDEPSVAPPDANTERAERTHSHRPPPERRGDDGRGRRGGRRGRRGGRRGRGERDATEHRDRQPAEPFADNLDHGANAAGVEVTTSLELSTPVTAEEFDDLPPPRPRPNRRVTPTMPAAERRTADLSAPVEPPPEEPAKLEVIDTGKSAQFIDYASFGKSVLGDLEPPAPPPPPPSQVVSLAPIDVVKPSVVPDAATVSSPTFQHEGPVAPETHEHAKSQSRGRRDARRRSARTATPEAVEEPASSTGGPRPNGDMEPTDVLPPRMAEEFQDAPPAPDAFPVDETDEMEEDDAGSGNWSSKPRRRRSSPRASMQRQKPPIQEIFRRGQEVLVQVIKEGIGTKGPTLSTYISIPGRYLVLMPGLNRIGVSRKIIDEDQRYRLRDLLRELKPPHGLGFIIRTAGVDRTKKELLRDLHYLTRLWNVIVRRIRKTRGPTLIYQESDMITRTIRDVFSSDIESIYVDEPKAYEHAKEFLQFVMPRYVDRLHLDTGTEPLFHRFGLEREINRIQQRRLPLPGGGSIVIDQAEALVAIDVNSGNHRVDNDAEETAFRVNLTAAREIARQLRLRDLGGVIVIDFIDMREERHRREVERALRDAIKRDRARTKPLRMSQFGIIEMTRQRIRPSLERSSLQDCPSCRGTGQVKTSESMSIEVMRLLQLVVHRSDIVRVQVRVADAVAQYLLNRKRKEITELEEAGKMQVTILGVPHGMPEMLEIECQDPFGGDVRILEQEPIEPRPRPPRSQRH